MRPAKARLHPSLLALIEVGIWFLPAIPAYLWVWPKWEGALRDAFQVVTYLYVLGGALWIGLRRYRWDELGFNGQGIGLTLTSGAVVLVGRLMIIWSITWSARPAPLTWLNLIGNLLFYFGLVGLTEELLFRGLIYRSLEDWRGARWALWGSSIGFMLWHIVGQGPWVGFATLVIGLFFGLLRWRGGDIVGLIVLHGLWDLESVLLVASSNAEILKEGAFSITYPAMTLLGTALLIAVPLYVWLLHPRLARGS